MHYFIANIDGSQQSAIIENEEAHHCATVLRLKAGDTIGILNAQKKYPAKIYTCELISVHKKECVAKIKSIQDFHSPPVKTHLIVSPPKNNERLEWMIEKSVELQVSSLLFVKSERCIRKTLNVERLKKIVLTAAKQSINPLWPEIREYNNLLHLIKDISSDNAFYLLMHCEPSDKKTPFDLNFLQLISEKKYSEIYAFIGPEGDWTKEEIKYIQSSLKNIIEINLGNTRLRTETAAISVLSLLRLS